MRTFRGGWLIGFGLGLSTAALLVAGITPLSASATPAPSSSPVFLSGHTVYPFTFTEPNGKKVTIKKAPTRIITVDNPEFTVSDLAALGLKPIGGETYPSSFDAGDPAYTSQGIAVVDDVPPSSFKSFGTAPSTPDLETIAAAHPGLIVGANGSGTSDLTQLEDIAPVADVSVSAPPSGMPIEQLTWYHEMRLLAQILDRQSQFNAFVAKFQAAAAAVRPNLTGKTVSVVEPTPNFLAVEGQVHAYDFPYLGLTVLPVPKGGVTPAGFIDFTELSPERASELTGQYLFLSASAAQIKTTLANPVIQLLPSVKAGRVVRSVNGNFGGYNLFDPTSQLLAIPYVAKAFETAGTKP